MRCSMTWFWSHCANLKLKSRPTSCRRILGSHSGNYEEFYLLVYDAV
jgi:hypothetical protein